MTQANPSLGRSCRLDQRAGGSKAGLSNRKRAVITDWLGAFMGGISRENGDFNGPTD